MAEKKPGLADLSSAYRTRDAIRKIAKDTVSSEIPRPRYALVVSVDALSRIVECKYPEETVTFNVKAGSLLPLAAGAVVRIAGPNGSRYIEDVIEGAVSVNGVDTSSGITVWSAATLGAGWGSIPGYQECQFRMERDLVRVRGFARKFAAAASLETILTLPVGVPTKLYTSAWTSDGGAAPIQAQRPLEVWADGSVKIAVALGGGTNWVAFDHAWSTL